MPPKQRPSFLKRQKEMARLQKQREKSAKRLARKQERETSAAAGIAVDSAPESDPPEVVQPLPVVPGSKQALI